jgi:hypothetical protein
MIKFRELSNTQNLQAIIFAFCLFLLSLPYYTWHTIFLNKLLVYVILLISIINIRKLTKGDFLILPLFIFILLYLAHSFSSNILGYISLFTFLFVLLINKSKNFLFFKYYKSIFAFSLALSLIIYVVIVFFNINVSYNLIEPLQEDKLNYYQYPFLISQGKLGFDNFNIRFSGMFDEPGVIGTLAVFFLFGDNFKFKNYENVIILISGILTFSFYFYICMIFYSLYKTSIKNRLFIILILILTFYYTTSIPIINQLVWNRFIIEDGKIAGDNRSTTYLDYSYEKFLKSNDVLWGKGIKYTQSVKETSSSFKTVIISYGLIFFCILILAFSLNAYFNIYEKSYFILYMIIFLGMIYQRPSFISMNYFFLLIASTYSLTQNKKTETNGHYINNEKNLDDLSIGSLKV